MAWSRPVRRALFGLVAVLIVTIGAVLAATASPGAGGGHGAGESGDHGGHGESAGHDGGTSGRGDGAGSGGDAAGADRGGAEATPAGVTAASVAGAIGHAIGINADDKGIVERRNDAVNADARPGKSRLRGAEVLPFKTIERLARKGNLYAKWRLARLHERSKVFPRNRAKAFRLYNEIFKAYRSGDLYSARTRFIQEALISIASYYRSGLPEAGVKKNPARAYSILKHVALYGHPRAQYMIGRMQLRGEGTAVNRKQGMRWLNLAAQKKYAAAQAELGRLYASKEAPSADRAKSLMWLGLAKGNEQDSKTRQSVSEMYESMLIKANREERDRAENLTLGWQQRYGSE